jgi:hypothetical protein
LRKRELPLFPAPLFSPFQYLFAASHFSDAGLRARRVAFASAVGLVAFAALDFIFS